MADYHLLEVIANASVKVRIAIHTPIPQRVNFAGLLYSHALLEYLGGSQQTVVPWLEISNNVEFQLLRNGQILETVEHVPVNASLSAEENVSAVDEYVEQRMPEISQTILDRLRFWGSSRNLEADEPYRMLVLAQAVGQKHKGFIADIRDVSIEWGAMEVLPTYIRVEVTDGDGWIKAKNFQQQWIIKYTFTIESETVDSATYTVATDPELISASGKGSNQMKTEMVDFIENAPEGSIWYGSTVDSFTASSMTVTIPKPHLRPALKLDFDDKFSSMLEIDRYVFTEQGVDWAISQGGSVFVTQQQALNNIVDRLDF